MKHASHIVLPGTPVRLADIDTASTGEFDGRKDAEKRLAKEVERLAELQETLWASDRHAVLVVLQAMDTAGKDGIIRHVMSGVNPQGVRVTSFRRPSSEELDHDFLWRTMKAVPERGTIGVFNRSYYEEVIAVRVHSELLDAQKLPRGVVSGTIWQDRFEQINNYERYLTRNGVVVVKFFLHISKQEQKDRLIARIDTPEKNWKFAIGDVDERQHWDEYMLAYEDAINNTSTEHAPWHVIPADRKWYARTAVASAIVRTLESLDLAYPTVSDEQREKLKEARRRLESEG